MAILEGRGIVKEYKQGENSVFALNCVDVSFEEGSFIAITGESGSGKSTLLTGRAWMMIPSFPKATGALSR